MRESARRRPRGRGPGRALAFLVLCAGLAAPAAHAGLDSSLARLGDGTNRAGAVGGAMQLGHQVDQLYTLLDHLHRLWKWGPYAEHKTRTDTPTPPGDGGSSTRSCTYPAGYPRVPAPKDLPSSDNSTPIRALIIRDIGSRPSDPAPPDLGKWRGDAQGLDLRVAAGPVLGAYLLDLPTPMSRAQADQLIRHMYLADASQDGSATGCRYDYITVDEPVDDFGVMPPAPPRLGIGASGNTSPITSETGSELVVSPSIGRDVLSAGWPMIGYWANTAVAPDPDPLPMRTVAIALIDSAFMPGSGSNPVRTRYHGAVTLVNRTGRLADNELCKTSASVVQGHCHGDLVAAVLRQDVGRVVSQGRTMLVGGILGSNLYYYGTADQPANEPLYGRRMVFPLERVQVEPDEFHLIAAMDYVAGRTFGYAVRPDKTLRLTDYITKNVTRIDPLSPRPRVLNISIGLATRYGKGLATSLCKQPLMRKTLQLLDGADIIVVASSGNLNAPNIASALAASKLSGGKVESLPGDCSGVIEVGGSAVQPAPSGAPEIVPHPTSRIPRNPVSFWAPFTTSIAVDADGKAPRLATLDGTSFSSPVVAGTIAVMLSIDPGLDREQLLDDLTEAAASAKTEPPVRLAPPAAAWRLALQRRVAEVESKPMGEARSPGATMGTKPDKPDAGGS